MSRTTDRPSLPGAAATIRALVRFGLVGLLNTAVGFGVMAALLHLGAGDYLANACGYGVGMCVSFVLNRAWTFSVRGMVVPAEIVRFTLVLGASYAVNLAVLTLMRAAGFAHSLIGQGAAMAAYSLCFFVLSRRFVFGAAAPLLRS